MPHSTQTSTWPGGQVHTRGPLLSHAANYNSQHALPPGRLCQRGAHALADVAPGTRRRGAAGKWRRWLPPAELRSREPEWGPEPAVGSCGGDGAGRAGVVAAAAGGLGEAVALGSGPGRHVRPARVRGPCSRPSRDVRGDTGRLVGGVRAEQAGTRWLRGRQRGGRRALPAGCSGAQRSKGARGGGPRGRWAIPRGGGGFAPRTQLCRGAGQVRPRARAGRRRLAAVLYPRLRALHLCEYGVRRGWVLATSTAGNLVLEPAT